VRQGIANILINWRLISGVADDIMATNPPLKEEEIYEEETNAQVLEVRQFARLVESRGHRDCVRAGGDHGACAHDGTRGGGEHAGACRPKGV